MLKNINALKKQANSVLLRSYWKTVFTSALLMIVSVGTIYNTISDFFTDLPKVYAEFQASPFAKNAQTNYQIVTIMIILVGGLLLLTSLLRILITLLIKNPVEIGVCLFMKKNIDLENSEKVADICYAFDNNYIKNVKTLFFKDLYIFLWTILLIIPGIIKRYDYRLVSYLITDYPDAHSEELFSLSKKYMYGHRKEAFLLDLVFLPWHILGTITLGTVEILYVQPYKELVDAAFYKRIMNEYNK